MSIGIFNKKLQNIEPEVETTKDTPITSNLAIPFYIIFKKNVSPDIYNGEEIISFNDKDIEFKELLLNEFLIH